MKRKSKLITQLICFTICCLLFLPLAYSGEGNAFAKYKQLALLSSAAYESNDKILEAVEKNDWEVSHSEVIAGIEVLYFIATNDKLREQIIVVRGTANVENALVDAAHKLVLTHSLGVKLHEGFGQAAEKIYSVLTPHLNRDYKISTTGHSLGGGVAVILGMHLDNEKYRLGDVITFGQPKVTNITGAMKYKHLAVTRIVTPKDLVPLVPPFDAMDINNLGIYWHVGTEVILLAGLEYSEIAGLDSMLRATKILSNKIDNSNLDHHRMTLYLQLLDSKVNKAVKVEYENRINVFKLFSGS